MTGGTVTSGDVCPGCESAIDDDRVVAQDDVLRFSCLGCGLQLVRRRGGDWTAIRG